jgi:hypothetical protein
MFHLPRAAALAPLTLALLWGCAPKVPPDTAQDSSRDSTETGAPLAPRLLVSGYKSGAVLVLDPTTARSSPPCPACPAPRPRGFTPTVACCSSLKRPPACMSPTPPPSRASPR